MSDRRYKSVSVSLHTIDEGKLPIAGNVELLEIDIELFNSMSKQAFKKHVLKTADRFWAQMERGRLYKETKIKFKRRLSVDSIGNQ